MHGVCPTPPKQDRLRAAPCRKFAPYHSGKSKLPRGALVERIRRRLDACRTPSLERMLVELEPDAPHDAPPPPSPCPDYKCQSPAPPFALPLQLPQSPYNSSPQAPSSPDISSPICSQTQLQHVFKFFDKNNSGTIEKAEVEEVVKQLGLDVTSDTLAEMMDRFPQESLTFPMFSECLNRLNGQDGLFTSIVSETLQHLNKTIIRAKKLGLEMHSKVSLDKQLTNLFHMQNHYRMINKAKASVDSWHYATTSKCYHSHTLTTPCFRKNRRWLPMERMHMILSYSGAGNGESWAPLPPVAKHKCGMRAAHNAQCNSTYPAPLTCRDNWRPQEEHITQEEPICSSSSSDAPSNEPAVLIRRESSTRRNSSPHGDPKVHDRTNGFLAKQAEKLGLEEPKRASLVRRSSLQANDGGRRLSAASITVPSPAVSKPSVSSKTYVQADYGAGATWDPSKNMIRAAHRRISME